MAQAIASDERIGLRVETTADLSGTRAARQDVGALARDAKAMSQDLAGGANTATAATKGFAGAAREAADAQKQVFITTEQSNAMWARAGGDYSRFNRLVNEHVAAVKALALATTEARAKHLEWVAAMGGGAGQWQSPTAGIPSSAAASIARVSAEVDKIPNKARTAANALSTMAFAVSSGGSGLQGFAVAAGSAANSISMLSSSARLAASAAGIGALVTILGTVLVLLERAKNKAKEAGTAMAASLGDLADVSLTTRLRDLTAQRDALVADIARKGWFQIGRENLGRKPGEGAQADLEKVTAQLEVVFKEVERRRRDRGRTESKEEEERHTRDAARALEIQEDLAHSILDMELIRLNNLEALAKTAAERDYQRTKREIEQLQIAEDEKTEIIAVAYAERMRRGEAAEREQRERERRERDRIIADHEKAQKRSVGVVEASARSVLQASILGGESLSKAMTRALLTPLVNYLIGESISQGIAALKAASYLDWFGAGRHAAVSVAAAAAAQKVAQMGGLTAGSGGGSAAVGGGGQIGGGRGEGTGNVTVVIQTVDPLSGAVINEVGYRLQRGEVLKQPLTGEVVTGYPAVRAA